MRNHIVVLFFLGWFNVSFAGTYNDLKCEKYAQIQDADIIVEMIRSSNFNFKNWATSPKEINAFCDKEQNEIICQIGLDNVNYAQAETASFSPIGTISYNTLTGSLHDISVQLEHPIELVYDQTWNEIFNAINHKDKIRCLVLHEKKYLYNSPDLNIKSKKFLIKNDCAMVLDQKSNDWYKIFFHNQKAGTNTVLWIKDGNITLYDEMLKK